MNPPFGNLSLRRKALQNGICGGFIRLSCLLCSVLPWLVCLRPVVAHPPAFCDLPQFRNLNCFFWLGEGWSSWLAWSGASYPYGAVDTPKSIQVLLWISPQEI